MGNYAKTRSDCGRRGTLLGLRLYLDDCAYSKRLLQELSAEPYNHYVEIPQQANLRGATDEVHFAYARGQDLIVITKNPDDFEALHVQHPNHPGIFAIYQDNDPRDMSAVEIVQAIQNLVDAEVFLAGDFHSLNNWRY